jgi:hypothetical protein
MAELAVAGAVLDYVYDSPDGSMEVVLLSFDSLMVLPARSLVEEALTNGLIAMSSASHSEGISEVGGRIIPTIILSSGKRFEMTHAPPFGWRGKHGVLRIGYVHEGNNGRLFPIDPDEPCQRVAALGRTVFCFSIAEPGTPTPTLVGIGSRIAQKLPEPVAFFGESEKACTANPDLIVLSGGFHDHPPGFPGPIGKTVVTTDEGPAEIISEQIGPILDGLHQDVVAASVLRFEIADVAWGGRHDPSSPFGIQNRQAPPGAEVSVEFGKKGFHRARKAQ